MYVPNQFLLYKYTNIAQILTIKRLLFAQEDNEICCPGRPIIGSDRC